MEKQIALQTLSIFEQFLTVRGKVTRFKKVYNLILWILSATTPTNITQNAISFLVKRTLPFNELTNENAYLRRLPPVKLFYLHPFQYLSHPFVNEALTNMLKNDENEIVGFIKFNKRILRHKRGVKRRREVYELSDPISIPLGYYGTPVKYRVNQGATLSSFLNYMEDFGVTYGTQLFNLGCWTAGALTFLPFEKWDGVICNEPPFILTPPIFHSYKESAERNYISDIQQYARELLN